MRIALVSNQAASMLNFRRALILKLVDRGHEVLAFAPDFCDDSKRALELLGVTAIHYSSSRTNLSPLAEVRSIFDLFLLFRRLKPDVALGFFLKPLFHTAVAGWLAGVKRRHGLAEGLGFAFSAPPKASFSRLIARYLAELAIWSAARILTKLLFLNNDDLKDFSRLPFAKTSHCSVVGAIGVELDEWSPRAFPPGPPTFIMVSRLLKDKGVTEYLKAAQCIKNEFSNVRFLLLGSTDDNPSSLSIDDLRSFLGTDAVEWPGYVDVKPWLSQSHVFVLPSYREGLPRSTQEAMAMGLAIITTNAPGCKDTVIPGFNGVLIPPRSTTALADAIRYFTLNLDVVDKMGKNSRHFAELHFDAQVQTEIFMKAVGLLHPSA